MEQESMNQEEFLDLYNALTGVFTRKFMNDKLDQNIVFSTFSILTLLSILADATDGSTRQEIQDMLYGELHHQGFSEQLKAVREELTRKENHYHLWDYGDSFLGKPILDRDDHLCPSQE